MAPVTHLIAVLMMALRVSSSPVKDTFFATGLLNRSLPVISPNDPKRELPFQSTAFLQKWNGSGSQVSWAYNWDSTPPHNFPKDLEFVPMLWSADDSHTKQVTLHDAPSF